MTDWSTIASVGTAAGTLVLAIATFAAVRSGNRSARATERALLAGIRPVLVTSRPEDPAEKVGAVLDRWDLHVDRPIADSAPDVQTYRRLTRDIYVPSGDHGFWQGALRDPSEPIFADVRQAVEENRSITIDLLYGDHEGGQRTISRFTLLPNSSGTVQRMVAVSRHWNLDRSDPR